MSESFRIGLRGMMFLEMMSSVVFGRKNHSGSKSHLGPRSHRALMHAVRNRQAHACGSARLRAARDPRRDRVSRRSRVSRHAPPLVSRLTLRSGVARPRIDRRGRAGLVSAPLARPSSSQPGVRRCARLVVPSSGASHPRIRSCSRWRRSPPAGTHVRGRARAPRAQLNRKRPCFHQNSSNNASSTRG